MLGIRKSYGCGKSETYQPWPAGGQLAKALNWALDNLRNQLRNQHGEAYAYVVKSVKPSAGGSVGEFRQTGCGPNFQGDLITQCTCRPDLRSKHTPSEWEEKWIAGFTSKSLGEHYLFYLMKISKAFDSQAEIWRYLQPEVRKAKSSKNDIFGDIFEPRMDKRIRKDDEWKPENYHKPIEGHVHAKQDEPEKWHRDINYQRGDKRQCFLIGDKTSSFLWKKPVIFKKTLFHPHPIRWQTYNDIQELLSDLEEI